MFNYPYINPIAFELGPLKVHWYGLMYLFSFVAGWALCAYRAKKPNSGWSFTQVSDLLFYIALGIIIGGRLGYVLIYAFPKTIDDPLSIFKLWQGGMSFHGGFIGVLFASWLFARHTKKSFTEVTDFFVPVVPLGLAAGRLGNFINAELWGRITDVPWAMIFPGAGPFPRHPSQLYASFLEGILLFIIVWFYSANPRPRMAVSALFVLGYGLARFSDEFFRQPDPQFGFVAFDWMTMGQLLSIPMIILGVLLLAIAYRKQ